MSFKLSLRDLVIMMADRGISVAHTTIPLGPALHAGVREALASLRSTRRPTVEDGRNLYKGPRTMGVSVPRRRQSGPDQEGAVQDGQARRVRCDDDEIVERGTRSLSPIRNDSNYAKPNRDLGRIEFALEPLKRTRCHYCRAPKTAARCYCHSRTATNSATAVPDELSSTTNAPPWANALGWAETTTFRHRLSISYLLSSEDRVHDVVPYGHAPNEKRT